MSSAASAHGESEGAPDVLDRPEAGARAIRGGVIRTIAYYTGLVLAGLAVPLLTRHLGPVDFGRFVTASTIVMIVAGITEFGITAVATRDYVHAPPGERQALLASVLGLRTVLTLIGLAIAAAFMVLGHYPGVEVVGMLISGLGLVLLNTEQTYAIVLNADLRWGTSAVFDLIRSAVVGAATFTLVVVGAQLLSFFWVSVVSSGAALIAAGWYLRRRVSLLPRLNTAHWRQMTRDTLPYAVATTVGILYPRIGLLAVSLISNSFQTGYYSTAYKVVEVLGATTGLIAGTAFPIFARAARDDHERLGYATSKVTDTSLIAGVYIALSLIVTAPLAIRVLGGPGYGPAAPVLQIQALALLAGFLATTWSQTLLSLRMHGAILRASGVALLLAIVLSAALVPALGARGAAIASAVAEAVVAGGYLLALARAHPQLRPRLAIAPRLLLVTAIAAVPCLLLPLPSVVLWAIGSLVFAVGVWVLGVLPEELIDALLAWRGARGGPKAGDDGGGRHR